MRIILKIIGLLILGLTTLQLQAQDRTIEGKVTDESDIAMPGVNVLVKGTNVGTATDEGGRYEIKVDGDVTLIFSMIGFKEVEVATREYDSNVINITMEEETIGLDEVTVVGYSEIETEHVASSVAKVDMEKIETQTITKMEEAFSGTIPGVVMRKTNNMPGDLPGSIRIRGKSTLQNADPLVLVDGVEQSLHDLDPDNIEDITVLKDAASAAMYGSRGANGVIVITTKRGVADEFKVDLRASMAFDDPIKLPDFVNSANYMKLRNEARNMQGQSPSFTQDEIALAENGKYQDVNWLDQVMTQRAYSQNLSASISGGGGVGTFNLMLGFKNSQGLNRQGQELFTARFNTDINVADRFVLLADFYARRLNVTHLHVGGGNSIFGEAWKMNPTQAVYYDSTDRANHYMLHNNDMNPVASMNEGGISSNLHDRITLNLRPRYNINENLSLRGNVSYLVNKSASKYERDTYKFFDAEGKPVKIWSNAVGSSQGTSVSQLTSRALLNFEKGLRKDKDKIYVTAGAEAMIHNFTDYREYSKASFFGKLNYSFDDRYLIEATVRTDGSSKFAPGHRWGFFPSGALAWNLHNERFMSGLTDPGILNEMKIRLSYGLVGNENIAPYLWEEDVNNWGWTERVPNPEFSWESQTQANLGVDLKILNNRLSFTGDLYRKHSYDLIFSSFPIPPLTGSSNLESSVNIGEVENKGWELSASWQDNIGDFSYSIGGMIFDNRNKVLKAGYTKSDTLIFKGTSERIWYRGITMDNYYGYESDGYFQDEQEVENTEAKLPNTKPGDIRYVDQNGDGVINSQDRVNLGDPTSHYNYAINLDLSYKRWDFSMMGQGVGQRTGRLGGLVGYPVLMDGGSNSYGTPRQYYMNNRWTPDTPNSRFPRVWTGSTPNDELSDVWLSDASYFRISLIEVGYSLPKIGNALKNVRFYLNVQDPFVFTNWEGFDPEKDGSNGRYPRMRSFSLGIKATLQ